MPDDAKRSVSVICRHCGDLVGGVPAGDSVRWSYCTSENQQQRQDGAWVCAVPLAAPPIWRVRAFLRRMYRAALQVLENGQ